MNLKLEPFPFRVPSAEIPRRRLAAQNIPAFRSVLACSHPRLPQLTFPERGTLTAQGGLCHGCPRESGQDTAYRLHGW